MAEFYYLNNNNEQQGPVSKDVLKNTIKPETLVWRAGLSNWVPADSLDELKDLFLPAPAAPVAEETAPVAEETVIEEKPAPKAEETEIEEKPALEAPITAKPEPEAEEAVIEEKPAPEVPVAAKPEPAAPVAKPTPAAPAAKPAPAAPVAAKPAPAAPVAAKPAPAAPVAAKPAPAAPIAAKPAPAAPVAAKPAPAAPVAAKPAPAAPVAPVAAKPAPAAPVKAVPAPAKPAPAAPAKTVPTSKPATVPTSAVQQPKKSNKKLYIIGGIVGGILLLVIIGIVGTAIWWYTTQKNLDDYNYSTDTEEVVYNDYEEQVEEAAPAEEVRKGFEEVDMPHAGQFNMGIELANMAAGEHFVGTYKGMTVGDFDDISYKLTKAGKQMKYDRDGYRYQFFFDGSVTDDSSTITGVAVSTDLTGQPASKYDLVTDFEDVFEEMTLSKSGNNYITDIGSYVSCGYVGSRFYVYYYYENAPDKSPAPRK